MKKSWFVILFLAAGCVSSRNTTAPVAAGQLVIDGKTFATAFQQRAAEYRALCYQAYNAAQLAVERLENVPTELPKAIMTDIDETVLNNSPYQAQQLLKGKDYDPASWFEWTAKGIADTVPGALGFFQFAASKGIEIFYVSNRSENEMEGTLQNLVRYQFPNADKTHLLLKKDVASKEDRRKLINTTHTIILSIGDNLNDLSASFEKKPADERMKVADALERKFGHELIVLPNPVYGDWENALYRYKYNLSSAQKDSAIKASLIK